VTVGEGSLFHHLLAGTFWCPDDAAPWDRAVGRTIELALSLRFAGGPTIALAAASCLEEGGEVSLLAGGDEIAVIWDADVVAELLPELGDPWAAS